MTLSKGKKLIFGTRGSSLALVQTRWVIQELRKIFPHLEIEEKILSTKGDRDKTLPLRQLGGDGLFVKELERALLQGCIDVAVHSLKDLPAKSPPKLRLAAIPRRAPAGDLLVSRFHPTLESFPPGSVIGTGSARRRVQLRWAAPALEIVPIRGNLDTRLRKLRDGEYDGIIVAEAGVARVGYSIVRGLPVEPLARSVMLPAPGQGALAVQVRSEDRAVAELVESLDCFETRSCVDAERAFLSACGGGCHNPIAAFARLSSRESMNLDAVVSRDDESFLIRLQAKSQGKESPSDLGRRLSEDARLWLGASNGQW